MKNLLLLSVLLISFSATAKVQLVSGDYGVTVRDRSGNPHHCTLTIENMVEQSSLVLNILDCPPQVIDVALYFYDDSNSYMSEKIAADTRRGGYKLYEITPESETQFVMTSYREYGDGRVGKPRKVRATLK